MRHALSEDLLRALHQRPWDFSFLQVCRWVEARTAPRPRIGEDRHPANEALRLGQHPATTFAPREIDSAVLEHGRLCLRQNGLGLYGPGGPLPLHLTEEIHERHVQLGDTTLGDFLDMFHHRWLSLFYRAWAQGQSAAGLDRHGDERFSVYVASLLGHRPSAGAADVQRPLPAHARLAAAGHLVRHARNPAGLAATLEQHFNLPFTLGEYGFHWLRLEAEDRARLGRGACVLGNNAVLGGHVPDRQSSAVLHAAPSDFAAYERLLPGNDWHARLTQWLRCFTGLELRWELRLSLPARAVPPCRLGAQVQLGRTAWLKTRNPETRLQGRVSVI